MEISRQKSDGAAPFLRNWRLRKMPANRAATGQSGVVPPIRRVHVRRAVRVRVRAFVGPPTEKGEGEVLSPP